jgi:2-iminobutanoate/2-iminopropanoate deaminase
MATTNARHNPKSIMPPHKNVYAHGVTVVAGSEHLYTAGEVGVRPDGTISPVFEEQAEQLMANFKAILESAGMTFEDVVKVTTYCLKSEDVMVWAGIRNRYLGEHRPASTSVVVAGLAFKEWLIEAEMVAAKKR